MFEQPDTLEIPKSRMETLKEKGIVSFDVGFTQEEKESIEKINIDKDLAALDFYGPVTRELIQKLSTYLTQLDGNTPEVIEIVSRLLARVAEGMQNDSQQEAVWMTIRITLPNDSFDVPRWHQDGHYTKSDDGSFVSEEYKLVFTAKGVPTRFAEIVDQELYEQCEQESVKNYELSYEGDQEKYETEELLIRKKLELAVKERDAIPKGQAVMYRVGGKDAKVHSEPPIKTGRIFISVVAGSIQQIEELKQRFESRQ